MQGDHVYTVNGYSTADVQEAHDLAARGGFSLYYSYRGQPAQACPVSYEVIDEDDRRLWIRSPVGVVGIPKLRHRPARAVAVSLVVLEPSSTRREPAIQTMWVDYEDGTWWSCTAQCF